MAVTAPLLSQTLARALRRVRLLLLLRHGATGILAGVLVSGVLLLLVRTGALAEETLPPNRSFLRRSRACWRASRGR